MNTNSSPEEGEIERIKCGSKNDVLVRVSVPLWGACFSTYFYQIIPPEFFFILYLYILILTLFLGFVYRLWLYGKLPSTPERPRRNNDGVPWYVPPYNADACCAATPGVIIGLAAQAGKLPYPLFRLGQILWCVAPAVIAHIIPGFFLEVIFLFNGVFIITGLDYFGGFYTLLLLHLGSFVATIYASVSLSSLIAISSLSLVVIILCSVVAYRQPAQAIVDQKPAATDSAV